MKSKGEKYKKEAEFVGENEPNLSRIKFLSMLSRAVKKHKISYIGAHTGWGKTTAILQWMKIQKNKNIY